MHDIALIALYEGLRANEILSLRWDDINWQANYLAIMNTKNGIDRMQPLHPQIKEILLRRRTAESSGYVFKSRNGEKIAEVSSTFSRVVNALGFNKGITENKQKIVFHTLRHTYASWLVMNGVDLYTTQKLLGHKSNQMTQRYAHLAPGHLERAVNTLKSI
ncbi:MAG: site-specific integrase [Alphaproteobacteria bacterium]|nr:site-specific integrase [Alphaproteobacteria bacterium]